MIIFSSSLLKKSLNKTQSLFSQCRSLHAFQTLHFICYWFGCKTLFWSDQFRTMLEIISKLLCMAIWSHSAVLLESEQTPFARTCSQFRSAALHRIQFGIWGFVPMPYLDSETNEWSQALNIKQSNHGGFSQQQVLAKTIENFISHFKKACYYCL